LFGMSISLILSDLFRTGNVVVSGNRYSGELLLKISRMAEKDKLNEFILRIPSILLHWSGRKVYFYSWAKIKIHLLAPKWNIIRYFK
jgi:hypothetical protein